MTNPPQRLLQGIQNVFLDRDGVINHKMPEGRYVTSPEELILFSGTAGAIATLNHAGVRVLVVTNQRGVSLGLYSERQLAAIHRHLQNLLADEGAYVDAIYFCPHARESCDCRKPRTGMFKQAFKDFPGVDSGNSLMIGDSLSDIEAGYALGMPTVFIEGAAATQPAGGAAALRLATYAAPSLASFVSTYF